VIQQHHVIEPLCFSGFGRHIDFYRMKQVHCLGVITGKDLRLSVHEGVVAAGPFPKPRHGFGEDHGQGCLVWWIYSNRVVGEGARFDFFEEGY
jgi:hypothetical protein